MKTLTKDNLEENEKCLLKSNLSLIRNQRIPHFSTATTDSDYLSTIPTETTDFMNSYSVLGGKFFKGLIEELSFTFDFIPFTFLNNLNCNEEKYL